MALGWHSPSDGTQQLLTLPSAQEHERPKAAVGPRLKMLRPQPALPTFAAAAKSQEPPRKFFGTKCEFAALVHMATLARPADLRIALHTHRTPQAVKQLIQ